MMLRAPLTYGVFTIMPRLTVMQRRQANLLRYQCCSHNEPLLQKLKQLMDVRSDAAYVLRQTKDEFL